MRRADATSIHNLIPCSQEASDADAQLSRRSPFNFEKLGPMSPAYRRIKRQAERLYDELYATNQPTDLRRAEIETLLDELEAEFRALVGLTLPANETSGQN